MGEGGALEAQPVAHVVEADGMGELREKHRREVAADAEGAGLRFDSRLPRVLTDEPSRNEVEQLLEDGNIGSGWRFLFHTPLPSGRGSKGASPLFSPRSRLRCGTAVNSILSSLRTGGALWIRRGTVISSGEKRAALVVGERGEGRVSPYGSPMESKRVVRFCRPTEEGALHWRHPARSPGQMTHLGIVESIGFAEDRNEEHNRSHVPQAFTSEIMAVPARLIPRPRSALAG